jgi:hypothetical protein
MLYRPGQVTLVGVGSIHCPAPAMPSQSVTVALGERVALVLAAAGGPVQGKDGAETTGAT